MLLCADVLASQSQPTDNIVYLNLFVNYMIYTQENDWKASQKTECKPCNLPDPCTVDLTFLAVANIAILFLMSMDMAGIRRLGGSLSNFYKSFSQVKKLSTSFC